MPWKRLGAGGAAGWLDEGEEPKGGGSLGAMKKLLQ